VKAFEERVADLYATANPCPAHWEAVAAPERFPFVAEEIREIDGEAVRAWPGRRASRPWIAVAAAVLVLLVGVTSGAILWLTGEGGRVASPTEPITIVEEFYTRWDAGDIDGALSLADPEWSQGMRSYLEAIDALGGRFGVSGCIESSANPGVLSCRMEYTDPVAEATGAITGGYPPAGFPAAGCFITPTVEGGVVTYHAFSGDCQPVTPQLLAQHATRVDPEGLATECVDPGDDSAFIDDGFAERYGFAVPLVYNRRCFDFLAGLVPSLVAEIDSERGS
jgi:hypothetical protein